jgi:hypothetical protein
MCIDYRKIAAEIGSRVIALSAQHIALRDASSFPVTADERAAIDSAYAEVRIARADYLAASRMAARQDAHAPRACRYSHCCEQAEHVAGTHYAHETNCPVHGNKPKGTCD